MAWRAVFSGLVIGSLGASVVLLRAHLKGQPVLPPATLQIIELDELGQEAAPEVRLAALGEVAAGPDEASTESDPFADEPARTEAAPPPPPSPDLPSFDAVLAALGKETVVYEAPDRTSRRLGFLRTGAVVNRAAIPKSTKGCTEGWYRIAPEGFVCVGRTATLDAEHPAVAMTWRRPDRSLPMPYTYGKARGAPPPLYGYLPAFEEQKATEKDLSRQRSKKRDAHFGLTEIQSAPPPQVEVGQRLPRPFGYPVLPRTALVGHGLANSAMAFVDLFEAEGRNWGITTDLLLVPLDRLLPVEKSEFQGLALDEETTLPVVFVKSRKARLFAGNPEERGLEPERALGYREAFSLSGRQERVGGEMFLETRSGHWLKDQNLVRIDPLETLPNWAKGRRTWLDVSVVNQTLVAYEGATPRYVTLVSTGKDGLGDPQKTHSTPRGTFVIHTKHVTATMTGDEPGDEFDLQDIPYVQYFHQGFALHAAFWHDVFGTPRSHGCINLSPQDARWLFSWTDPPVPQQWHTALSMRGSLIQVRP